MRRLLGIVAAVAVVTAVPALADEMTLTGELVDHACFMRSPEDGTGSSHTACAESCARSGQPVALVTEKGDVYMLAGQVAADNNAALVPHMSHTVEATGEITEADGVKTLTTDAVEHVSAN